MLCCSLFEDELQCHVRDGELTYGDLAKVWAPPAINHSHIPAILRLLQQVGLSQTLQAYCL